MIDILSRSQLKDKFFDFLVENRLMIVVLSGRLQILERDFGVLFLSQQCSCVLRNLASGSGQFEEKVLPFCSFSFGFLFSCFFTFLFHSSF